jgi:cyanate lyase
LVFELPVEAFTSCRPSRPWAVNATAVAGDPVIHRIREIVAVHGPAINELIHEEFGDGIMSAIDFRLRLDRRAAPGGDQVELVLSGTCLPCPAA